MDTLRISRTDLRQLGYNHAKFIMQIEAVASLSGIGQGQGGYWEDVGFYDWYAGI